MRISPHQARVLGPLMKNLRSPREEIRLAQYAELRWMVLDQELRDAEIVLPQLLLELAADPSVPDRDLAIRRAVEFAIGDEYRRDLLGDQDIRRAPHAALLATYRGPLVQWLRDVDERIGASAAFGLAFAKTDDVAVTGLQEAVEQGTEAVQATGWVALSLLAQNQRGPWILPVLSDSAAPMARAAHAIARGLLCDRAWMAELRAASQLPEVDPRRFPFDGGDLARLARTVLRSLGE